MKALVRRAQLYEETEKLDEALEDFKKVLTYDPSHTEANVALQVTKELYTCSMFVKYLQKPLLSIIYIDRQTFSEITCVN